MNNVKIDLYGDFEKEIISEVKNSGGKIPAIITNKDELLIKCFNFLNKKGGNKPRKINISKEFSCPKEYKRAFEKLVKIIKNGGDIGPYLSKSVKELKNDELFNDWGIIHMHLGKKLSSDNYHIERTGPLVFLYIKGTDAYFIKIYTHGDWAKEEILQIIENNWPELIKPFMLKGVVGLNGQITENDRLKLRRSGINGFVELIDKNGKEIFIGPPGGGLATSGDAILDVMKMHKIKKDLKDLQLEIIENPDSFIIMPLENKNNEDYDFVLSKYKDNWFLQEKNRKSMLRIDLRYN